MDKLKALHAALLAAKKIETADFDAWKGKLTTYPDEAWDALGSSKQFKDKGEFLSYLNPKTETQKAEVVTETAQPVAPDPIKPVAQNVVTELTPFAPSRKDTKLIEPVKTQYEIDREKAKVKLPPMSMASPTLSTPFTSKKEEMEFEDYQNTGKAQQDFFAQREEELKQLPIVAKKYGTTPEKLTKAYEDGAKTLYDIAKVTPYTSNGVPVPHERVFEILKNDPEAAAKAVGMYASKTGQNAEKLAKDISYFSTHAKEAQEVQQIDRAAENYKETAFQKNIENSLSWTNQLTGMTKAQMDAAVGGVENEPQSKWLKENAATLTPLDKTVLAPYSTSKSVNPNYDSKVHEYFEKRRNGASPEEAITPDILSEMRISNPDYKLDEANKTDINQSGVVEPEQRKVFWEQRNKENPIAKSFLENPLILADKKHEALFNETPSIGAGGGMANSKALEGFKNPNDKVKAYYNMLLSRMIEVQSKLADSKGIGQTAINALRTGVSKALNPAFKNTLEGTNVQPKNPFDRTYTETLDNLADDILQNISVGGINVLSNEEREYISLLKELKTLTPIVVSNTLPQNSKAFGAGEKGILDWLTQAGLAAEGGAARVTGTNNAGLSRGSAAIETLNVLQNAGVLSNLNPTQLEKVRAKIENKGGLVGDEYSLNPELGEMAGSSASFLLPFLATRRIVKIPTTAVNAGRLVNAAGKLTTAGKMANVLVGSLEAGLQYEVAGRAFPSGTQKEEMNFGTGFVGGLGRQFMGAANPIIAKAIGKLNRSTTLTGIGQSAIGQYVNKMAYNSFDKAFKEVAEESLQEMYQVADRSKDFAEFQKTMTDQFGTWNKGLGFLVSVVSMAHLDGFSQDASEKWIEMAKGVAERNGTPVSAADEKVAREYLDKLVESGQVIEQGRTENTVTFGYAGGNYTVDKDGNILNATEPKRETPVTTKQIREAASALFAPETATETAAEPTTTETVTEPVTDTNVGNTEAIIETVAEPVAEKVAIKTANEVAVGDVVEDINGKKGTVTGTDGGLIEMDMEDGGKATANPKVVELFKPTVETVVEPVTETIAQPVIETNLSNNSTSSEPVSKTVETPIAETVVETTTEAVTEPIAEAADEKAEIEKITDPEKRKAAEIAFVMKNLFAGVGEASANKIREYADRILAGEDKAKVTQGLPKSFTDGIDSLLAAASPTENAQVEPVAETKAEPSVSNKSNNSKEKELETTRFTNKNIREDFDGNKFTSKGAAFAGKGKEVASSDFVESQLKEGDKVRFFAEKWRTGVVGSDKMIRDSNNNPWGIMGILGSPDGEIINVTKQEEIENKYNTKKETVTETKPVEEKEVEKPTEPKVLQEDDEVSYNGVPHIFIGNVGADKALINKKGTKERVVVPLADIGGKIETKEVVETIEEPVQEKPLDELEDEEYDRKVVEDASVFEPEKAIEDLKGVIARREKVVETDEDRVNNALIGALEGTQGKELMDEANRDAFAHTIAERLFGDADRAEDVGEMIDEFMRKHKGNNIIETVKSAKEGKATDTILEKAKDKLKQIEKAYSRTKGAEKKEEKLEETEEELPFQKGTVNRATTNFQKAAQRLFSSFFGGKKVEIVTDETEIQAEIDAAEKYKKAGWEKMPIANGWVSTFIKIGDELVPGRREGEVRIVIRNAGETTYGHEVAHILYNAVRSTEAGQAMFDAMRNDLNPYMETARKNYAGMSEEDIVEEAFVEFVGDLTRAKIYEGMNETERIAGMIDYFTQSAADAYDAKLAEKRKKAEERYGKKGVIPFLEKWTREKLAYVSAAKAAAKELIKAFKGWEKFVNTLAESKPVLSTPIQQLGEQMTEDIAKGFTGDKDETAQVPEEPKFQLPDKITEEETGRIIDKWVKDNSLDQEWENLDKHGREAQVTGIYDRILGKTKLFDTKKSRDELYTHIQDVLNEKYADIIAREEADRRKGEEREGRAKVLSAASGTGRVVESGFSKNVRKSLIDPILKDWANKNKVYHKRRTNNETLALAINRIGGAIEEELAKMAKNMFPHLTKEDELNEDGTIKKKGYITKFEDKLELEGLNNDNARVMLAKGNAYETLAKSLETKDVDLYETTVEHAIGLLILDSWTNQVAELKRAGKTKESEELGDKAAALTRAIAERTTFMGMATQILYKFMNIARENLSSVIEMDVRGMIASLPPAVQKRVREVEQVRADLNKTIKEQYAHFTQKLADGETRIAFIEKEKAKLAAQLRKAQESDNFALVEKLKKELAAAKRNPVQSPPPPTKPTTPSKPKSAFDRFKDFTSALGIKFQLTALDIFLGDEIQKALEEEFRERMKSEKAITIFNDISSQFADVFTKDEMKKVQEKLSEVAIRETEKRYEMSEDKAEVIRNLIESHQEGSDSPMDKFIESLKLRVDETNDSLLSAYMLAANDVLQVINRESKNRTKDIQAISKGLRKLGLPPIPTSKAIAEWRKDDARRGGETDEEVGKRLQKQIGKILQERETDAEAYLKPFLNDLMELGLDERTARALEESINETLREQFSQEKSFQEWEEKTRKELGEKVTKDTQREFLELMQAGRGTNGMSADVATALAAKFDVPNTLSQEDMNVLDALHGRVERASEGMLKEMAVKDMLDYMTNRLFYSSPTNRFLKQGGYWSYYYAAMLSGFSTQETNIMYSVYTLAHNMIADVLSIGVTLPLRPFSDKAADAGNRSIARLGATGRGFSHGAKLAWGTLMFPSTNRHVGKFQNFFRDFIGDSAFSSGAYRTFSTVGRFMAAMDTWANSIHHERSVSEQAMINGVAAFGTMDLGKRVIDYGGARMTINEAIEKEQNQLGTNIDLTPSEYAKLNGKAKKLYDVRSRNEVRVKALTEMRKVELYRQDLENTYGFGQIAQEYADIMTLRTPPRGYLGMIAQVYAGWTRVNDYDDQWTRTYKAALRWIMPFVNTPLNVLQYTIDNHFLGALYQLSNKDGNVKPNGVRKIAEAQRKVNVLNSKLSAIQEARKEYDTQELEEAEEGMKKKIGVYSNAVTLEKATAYRNVGMASYSTLMAISSIAATIMAGKDDEEKHKILGAIAAVSSPDNWFPNIRVNTGTGMFFGRNRYEMSKSLPPQSATISAFGYSHNFNYKLLPQMLMFTMAGEYADKYTKDFRSPKDKNVAEHIGSGAEIALASILSTILTSSGFLGTANAITGTVELATSPQAGGEGTYTKIAVNSLRSVAAFPNIIRQPIVFYDKGQTYYADQKLKNLPLLWWYKSTGAQTFFGTELLGHMTPSLSLIDGKPVSNVVGELSGSSLLYTMITAFAGHTASQTWKESPTQKWLKDRYLLSSFPDKTYNTQTFVSKEKGAQKGSEELYNKFIANAAPKYYSEIEQNIKDGTWELMVANKPTGKKHKATLTIPEAIEYFKEGKFDTESVRLSQQFTSDKEIESVLLDMAIKRITLRITTQERKKLGVAIDQELEAQLKKLGQE